jgi:hypothetical protein
VIDALIKGFVHTLAYVIATAFFGWLFMPEELLA